MQCCLIERCVLYQTRTLFLEGSVTCEIAASSSLGTCRKKQLQHGHELRQHNRKSKYLC